MKMLDRDTAMNMILESHQNIAAAWAEHLEFWGDEKPGITNDFSVYVQYVASLVLAEKTQELVVASSLIEEFVEHGDSDVKYGATIGFLEGVTNILLSKSERFQVLFAQHLKPKSKEFCVELDKFWGTKTAGITNA